MSSMAFINGQRCELVEGESILTFVRRHRGEDHIPTLCDAPQLEPHGSCRVCSVEVADAADGPRRVVASCHTPVSDGMYLFTESEKIQRLRYTILELVISDHPLDCLLCEANGNCELQDVAARVGIRSVRYANGATHLDTSNDLSHPYMRSDLSKCINCYRCVRACDEVQGEFVLSVHGRGFEARIIKGLDTSFIDSPCVSCGACAQACPTAAISDRFKAKVAQTTDAPTRTICTYCGVGCNLDVYSEGDNVLSIQAPYDADVNHGHTCVKGRYAFGFYNHPDRLHAPLIRRETGFEEVTWDEAYAYIAEHLAAIREDYGSDAIAGISSSRCTNEENYLMQKFMRAVIGTNNIDGCARVCHAPTAYGMQQSFGTGAATNSIEEIAETDCILIVGANPTQSHPVTGARIKQAVMKGARLIVVDPMRIELTEIADSHLQLFPGTNIAVLNMMAYFILESGLVDEVFVQARCEAFDAYRDSMLQLDIDLLAREAGLDKEDVRDAALAYASAPTAMMFHGLGITEHFQGSESVMLLANLAMLTGNIGRRGCGLNPLRGQNNVQGAADMGVQPHQGAGYQDVTLPEAQAHYESIYGVSVPSEVGYKIPEMFDAARRGDLRALWIMGEDVVQTDPNTKEVVKSLECLDFLVVQELFMSNTAQMADVVLPGASFLEKSGTFTNGERRVQRVNQAVAPRPGCKADGQIMVDIMNRMGYPQAGYDPAVILGEIARAVPFFEGITWDTLGENGKQWPVAGDGTDTQLLHTETFKRGKGKFHFYDYEKTAELTEHEKEFPFVLTTGRALVHYNCGTMSRRTANSELMKEDVLNIHPSDAVDKGIEAGDLVTMRSARGEIQLRTRLTEEVNPGVVFTTFHFPEIMVNRITSNIQDKESLCPEYKVVSVDFERVEI